VVRGNPVMGGKPLFGDRWARAPSVDFDPPAPLPRLSIWAARTPNHVDGRAQRVRKNAGPSTGYARSRRRGRQTCHDGERRSTIAAGFRNARHAVYVDKIVHATRKAVVTPFDFETESPIQIDSSVIVADYQKFDPT
jgi:hypothetical protein